jgi:hypothetical protein
LLDAEDKILKQPKESRNATIINKKMGKREIIDNRNNTSQNK